MDSTWLHQRIPLNHSFLFLGRDIPGILHVSRPKSQSTGLEPKDIHFFAISPPLSLNPGIRKADPVSALINLVTLTMDLKQEDREE